MYLDKSIKPFFSADTPVFDQLMNLHGESFRQQKGRHTQRIQLGDRTCFIKQHRGVGWMEIIKNLLQLRMPVISAKNEWLAIQKLQSLGVSVPKILAYGERGMNPARKESFILMEELKPVISLEDLVKTWKQITPHFNEKSGLIEAVARIARILHYNGINHRDFYICHFLLNVSNGEINLIDLHRAQIRRLLRSRWIIKDLSGLYFSSKDSGLTQRDCYRFMKIYSNQSLRQILTRKENFWEKVRARGERLYSNHT